MSTTRAFARLAALLAVLCAVLFALRIWPAWTIVPAVLVVAALPALPLSVFGNLAQTRRLEIYEDGSPLKAWLAGPLVRACVAAVAALTMTVLAVPQLLAGTPEAWIVLVASAATVPILAPAIRRGVAGHVTEAFRAAQPVRLAWRAAVPLLGLAAVALALLVPAGEVAMPAPARSALVTEWVHAAAFLDRLQAEALGALDGHAAWQAVAALVLGPGAVAVYGASLGALAALPGSERARALGPASLVSPPPRPSTRVIGWTAAIVTAGAVFGALPWVATTEARIAATPPSMRLSARITALEVVVAERIGPALYAPGTVELLRAEARAAAAELTEMRRAGLIDAVDRAAEGMTGNVDAFLDDYYSLPGEYRRLFLMLSGDMTETLAADLASTLAEGTPAEDLRTRLAAVTQAGPEDLRAAVGQRMDDTLATRRVTPPEGATVEVTAICPAAPCLDLARLAASERSALTGRLTAAGGAGAVGMAGGAVAALVVKKVAAKGTLKLATKAMTKAVGSKMAASGVGVAVGGTLGSVVPVLGTAIGATVGGALGGLAVGVGVDAVLIEVKEALSRDTFRAEIVSGIEDWRRETHALLEPAPIE